jgi:polysaccharide biosynthesis protein PslG
MKSLNLVILIPVVAVAIAAHSFLGSVSSSAIDARVPTAAEAQLQPGLSSGNPLQSPQFRSRKGINAGDLRRLSESALGASVENIVALGVSWVRMDFPWSEIESTRGSYNTRGPDSAVRALGSRGIQVLGIIDYAPPWANGGKGQMYPPVSPTDFAAYATFLVKRFAPMGVHTWEIWNEPNLHVYWATGADPVLYTQLLKAAYVAIKSADAGATVLTGGLSPAANDGGDLTPMGFLTGIYDNGGQSFFDAVADHPYTYPFMPDDKSGGAYWWDDMNKLRALMVAHGDATKRIWMTEYGAPTNGPPGARLVSEPEQAIMLTKSYTISESYAWAGPFFWYSLHDGENSKTTVENFFGIIRFNGSYKPAYSALQRLSPR